MTSQVQEGQRPKAQPPITTSISLVTPKGSYQVNGMVNGSPTSFLLGTGAAVTLMRKDEWDHISLGTELEPWAEHNLVSIDGTSLLIYGHANCGPISWRTDIFSVYCCGGYSNYQGYSWHRFSCEVQWDSRCRKGTAYPRQSSTLELHRSSRQMQESISVRLEKSFRLPPFSEQMVLATVQGSVPGGPYC